jgi:hypothetical protein
MHSVGEVWDDHVDVLDHREFRNKLYFFITFLRAAKGREAVILRGTAGFHEKYIDLLLAVGIRILVRGPRIIVSDATIAPGSAELAKRMPGVSLAITQLAKALIRCADSSRVVWCVLSSEEVHTFRATWRLRRGRVVFTPFPHTLGDGTLEKEVVCGDYIFSGGNSLRDYDLLAEAVAGTALQVLVASHWSPPSPIPNLRALPVSHDEYQAMLRGARFVVVPLADSSRSAGQQSYLNAMALGKAVVVTRRMGVADYISHNVDGLIVRPIAGELRDVLEQLWSDEAVRKRLGTAGRIKVLNTYTNTAYGTHLISLASADGRAELV